MVYFYIIKSSFVPVERSSKNYMHSFSIQWPSLQISLLTASCKKFWGYSKRPKSYVMLTALQTQEIQLHL